MIKYLLSVLVGLALIACGSCAPQPRPSPVPVPTVRVDAGPAPSPSTDAGPQPDLARGVRDACTALAQAGCPEGGPKCGPVLQKALDERLTVVPLDCLVGVKTKADVHACGKFVACP